jgi:hypothetical protein
MATETNLIAKYRPKYADLLQFAVAMIPKEFDVCLDVRGIQINANKQVLSYNSPFFESMFSGKFESKKYELNCDPKILQKLIDILCFNIVPITEEEELEIIVLLDFFKITKLHEKMESDFIKKLTPNNAYRGWKYLKDPTNKETCEDKICEYLTSDDNDVIVIKTIESVEDMKFFLQSITGEGEEQEHWLVIDLIKKWYAVHQSKEGYHELSKLIDPNKLSREDLVTVTKAKMYDSELLSTILVKKIEESFCVGASHKGKQINRVAIKTIKDKINILSISDDGKCDGVIAKLDEDKKVYISWE